MRTFSSFSLAFVTEEQRDNTESILGNINSNAEHRSGVQKLKTGSRKTSHKPSKYKVRIWVKMKRSHSQNRIYFS